MMSLKRKLFTAVSMLALTCAMLLVGVWAVSNLSIEIGGTISFIATNVNARVSGSVTGSTSGKNPTTLEYSSTTEPTTEALNTWKQNLSFDQEGTQIEYTITIENLSSERSLFASVTDMVGSVTNLTKTINFTNGEEVEIGKNSSRIFAITFGVSSEDISLDGSYDYVINLRDANADVSVDAEDLSFLTIEYDDSAQTATITACTDTSITYVEIPAYIKKDDTIYAVTSIETSTFNIETGEVKAVFPASLQSVSLPSTLLNIGTCTFLYCEQLTSIIIPDSVVSIGCMAFTFCSGLKSITIPDSVINIDVSPFAFSGLTSVRIGSGVTNISDDAFYDCSGLTSVTIPSSVTSIGARAFEGCSGLTSIEIPDSVTSIGETAFRDCSGLTSVTIGSGVTSIGEMAFIDCSKLTTVVIDSETVASELTSKTSQEYLIENATTIYVKTEIVTAGKVGSYVANTTNFPNVETITSGEYAGYTKYSK